MLILYIISRPYDAKNPFLAPVNVNRELHKGGDRSCMHIEFDITGSKIRYVNILSSHHIMYLLYINQWTRNLW